MLLTIKHRIAPMTITFLSVDNKKVSYRKQSARRCRICPTPSLITVQNLVVVSHTVCALVGGHKHLEDDGAIRGADPELVSRGEPMSSAPPLPSPPPPKCVFLGRAMKFFGPSLGERSPPPRPPWIHRWVHWDGGVA